jgi:hypothetical protein
MAAAPPLQTAAYRLVVADELGTLKGESAGSAMLPQQLALMCSLAQRQESSLLAKLSAL